MAREKRIYLMWIVASALLVVLALSMLVRREMFTQLLTGTISVLILVSSLVSLFTVKRYQAASVAFAGTLIKGISGIIIAILALVLLFTSSQSTSHLMLKILAGQAVLSSLILCIEVFAIKKSAYRKKPLILEALGSAVVAVLVFLLPAQTASLIVTLVASVAIVVGIAGIVIGVLQMRSGKNVNTTPASEGE